MCELFDQVPRWNEWTWRISPSTPRSIRPRAATNQGCQRRRLLTASAMPAAWQAATISSASWSEVASGFSAQITLTPAPMRAISVTTPCRWRAFVQTETMSGRSRSISSR